MPTLDLSVAPPPLRRAVARVAGPDAAAFLQGTLTADVAGWDRARALPAALLTRKGQLVAEVIVVPDPAGGDGIGLVVPADVFDEVVSTLDRYLVMDDATVEPAPETRVWFAWEEPPGDATASHDGHGVIVPAVHPARGWLCVGPAAFVEAVTAGAPAGTAESFEAHRVACERPGWGHELRPGRLPPELGYADAVSYDKGCFLGQEPLARVHARGLVPRVMVRVNAAQAADPLPVELASDDRPQAGRLTTLVPAGERFEGLALVHRSVAVPGTALRVAGSGAVIEVCSGPIGDDPGASEANKARMKAARARLRTGK